MRMRVTTFGWVDVTVTSGQDPPICDFYDHIKDANRTQEPLWLTVGSHIFQIA